jgi:ATP-dependent Clp protease ATP-binding subunit ClpA
VFERFTERSRHVVVFAQEEARGLGHAHIGTEHLLLGLLRAEDGVAARVLDSLDVHLVEVREEVVQILGWGDKVETGQIPFTPRAKKALELSLREAISLGHKYIGTEHVLIGLVSENEGLAARILREKGYDAESVRAATLGMVDGPAADAVEERWHTLSREIDREEARSRPSELTLGSTLREVLNEVSRAQATAIAEQDIERAQTLTKLRHDLLAITRGLDAVLGENQPGGG